MVYVILNLIQDPKEIPNQVRNDTLNMIKVPLFTNEQLENITNNFVSELENASKGKRNSLAYIKNPVPVLPSHNQRVQCMVMGGSVFETAIVEQTDKGIQIHSLKKINLPVIKNKEIFTEIILSNLDPDVTKIGFCFAYPLEPIATNGYLDGILMRGTKEHTFDGLIGETIGQYLQQRIKLERNKNITISVANDTVCLVMAGKTMSNDIEGLAGGINGTGTNFAFFADKKTIINLESGNFNKFDVSDAVKIIDKSSNIPNDHLFEKEVAGGYLQKLFEYYAPEAHVRNEYISDIASGNGPYASVAQDILRRSASLLSCQIAGIQKYKSRPMMFVMEGSVFIKGYKYQEYVQEYLEILGVSSQIAFEKINHSSIVGASQLVL